MAMMALVRVCSLFGLGSESKTISRTKCSVTVLRCSTVLY